MDVHDAGDAADGAVDRGQQRVVVGQEKLGEDFGGSRGDLDRARVGSGGEGGVAPSARGASHGQFHGEAFTQVLGQERRNG